MTKPRFIAGAVCPQCQIVDRLVVEQDGEQSTRRCVSCGFVDQLKATHVASVPRGKPEKRPVLEAEPQTIKVFDPNASHN